MSVVVAVCGEYFAFMLSDGRKVQYSTGVEKKVEKIADDNTKKIFKINQNVVIGFAGNYHIMMKIVKHLNEFINLDVFSVEMIRRKIINTAKKDNYETLPLQVIICGKNSNGKYEITELSSRDNFSEKSCKPTGTNYYISSALPKDEYEDIRIEMIDSKIPNCTSTFEVKEHAEKFIKYISKIDETVNDKIMFIQI